VDFGRRPSAGFLLCAYVGHYACCNGDTWASELGVLDWGLGPRGTRLVTHPWLEVPRGTNGGMSFAGKRMVAAARACVDPAAKNLLYAVRGALGGTWRKGPRNFSAR